MTRQRRTVLRVFYGLAICVAAIILICSGIVHWTSTDRIKGAGAYASQIGNWPPNMVRSFPKSIPPGATGVRMRSDSPSLMASPSHFIEVRFIAQAPDVQSAIASGMASESQLKTNTGRDIRSWAEGSVIVDDGDRNTPLPAGFQFYRFIDEPARFAGVAVNANTGEILYWAHLN